MTSPVDICNMALGNIKAGSINDFLENSFQAQQCKLRYPIIRDKMVTDNKWGFAKKVEALELLDKMVVGWSYAYYYPNDCLKVDVLTSEIITTDRLYPSFDYEIRQLDGKKIIVCNEKSVYIDYRVKVENTALMNSSFILALSYLLAADLSIPIVGSKEGMAYRRECFSIYQQMLQEALGTENSERHFSEELSEFIATRNL